MKCRKGLVAGVVAVCMMGAMGVNAFAESTTNTTSGETSVKYDVSEAYTWVVPSEIDFTNAKDATVTTSGTSGNTQNVQVTKNVIENGKKLHIILDTTNTFKIISKEGAELSYTIKKDGNNLTAGSTVLDVEAGTATGSATLTFVLTKDTVEKAGNYTGTVAYSSSIEKVTSVSDSE